MPHMLIEAPMCGCDAESDPYGFLVRELTHHMYKIEHCIKCGGLIQIMRSPDGRCLDGCHKPADSESTTCECCGGQVCLGCDASVERHMDFCSKCAAQFADAFPSDSTC